MKASVAHPKWRYCGAATEDNGFTGRGVVDGLRLRIAPDGEQLLEKGLIDFSASQRSPAIVGNREKAVANAGQAARYAGSCVGVVSKAIAAARTTET